MPLKANRLQQPFPEFRRMIVEMNRQCNGCLQNKIRGKEGMNIWKRWASWPDATAHERANLLKSVK